VIVVVMAGGGAGEGGVVVVVDTSLDVLRWCDSGGGALAGCQRL
jgi:hypothetical protein